MQYQWEICCSQDMHHTFSVTMIIPRHITETPSEYSRAYFLTKEGIRSMAWRAIVQQKSSLLDQDAVENYLLEAK